MNTKDIKLYRSAEHYLNGPEGMKNEVMMWYVAGGILMQELAIRSGCKPYGGLKNKVGYLENAKHKTIEILDVCSGPGDFVNHLSFVYPGIKAICVDLNESFVRYGQSKSKKWHFIKADVVNFYISTKFDFITASSAYHHIEDGKKLNFLMNLKKHLKHGGVIIVCENFLPDYRIGNDRAAAVKLYYGELKKFYRNGNATKSSLKTILEVERLELAGVNEHKVSFRIFKEHIRKAGLEIDTDISVWQPKGFVRSNAGSHVIKLRLK